MNRLKAITCIICFLLTFSSCNKCIEKCVNECDLIPAKVIRYDCDRIIFQLLTDEAIGDSNWEDVQTGLRYPNIVSCYKTCEILALTKGEMTTLYVQIKPGDNMDATIDCAQCKAISPSPPQRKVDFVKIEKHPCDN